MAAALDDVGKAAWTAELAKQCGKYKMRPVVQAQLVQHFADMGEALAEAGLDVTKDDVEEWTSIWEGTLADAAVTNKRDCATFIAWGRARCSVAVRTAATADPIQHADGEEARANDHAGRALRLLEGSGVAIPEAVRAKLVQDFADNEAGDYSTQCCNAITVFILYLGRTVSYTHLTLPTNREV